MTHFMYNSKRIIPAPPAVSIQKIYNKTPDGTTINAGFEISINGTALADHGSPSSTGVFWDQSGYPPDETVPDASRLAAIMRKQEALRELFSEEGHTFEIQSADATAPMKCNPRVIGITFGEGLWYNTCPYTITLQADVIYINGQAFGEDDFSSVYISDASESWNLEVDDTPEGIDLPRTYRMSHTISATGKRFYDDTGTLVKQAWEQAQSYVLPRLGFSSVVALSSGINNLPDYYQGYNFSRSEQKDQLAGQYSVTENWILASGRALEEFNVETKNDPSNGLTSVSIGGTINGLEIRDQNMQLVTKKYTNALDKWGTVESSLLSRAQAYAGINLNPIPLSRLVGKNDINGVITYSYEFDSRPSNLFSGASFESITISENFPADLFAAVAVIGRDNGPVLQYLNSQTERAATLNIDVVIAPPSFGDGSIGALRTAFYGSNPRITQPNVFENIFQAARPGLNYNTAIELVRDKNENWDVKNGRYNFTCSFVFGN